MCGVVSRLEEIGDMTECAEGLWKEGRIKVRGFIEVGRKPDCCRFDLN